jgi:hypothetical protein
VITVSVPVTVRLDADKWARNNGISIGEVREDVRSYVLNLLQNSVMLVEEAGAEVTVRNHR